MVGQGFHLNRQGGTLTPPPWTTELTIGTFPPILPHIISRLRLRFWLRKSDLTVLLNLCRILRILLHLQPDGPAQLKGGRHLGSPEEYGRYPQLKKNSSFINFRLNVLLTWSHMQQSPCCWTWPGPMIYLCIPWLLTGAHPWKQC